LLKDYERDLADIKAMNEAIDEDVIGEEDAIEEVK